MKYIYILLLLLFFGSTLFCQDTLSIIDKWKQCPVGDPTPTLSHHAGKVATGIALWGGMSAFGVRKDHALFYTSAAAITFELIQVLFFNETLKHSLNDVILFSYHYPVYFFSERNPTVGITLTLSLTGVYLTLL